MIVINAGALSISGASCALVGSRLVDRNVLAGERPAE
jgi:hypothetical protein